MHRNSWNKPTIWTVPKPNRTEPFQAHPASNEPKMDTFDRNACGTVPKPFQARASNEQCVGQKRGTGAEPFCITVASAPSNGMTKRLSVTPHLAGRMQWRPAPTPNCIDQAKVAICRASSNCCRAVIMMVIAWGRMMGWLTGCQQIRPRQSSQRSNGRNSPPLAVISAIESISAYYWIRSC